MRLATATFAKFLHITSIGRTRTPRTTILQLAGVITQSPRRYALGLNI